MTTERNPQAAPSEKDFTLTKVKLVKDGGLDAHFEVAQVIGNENYTKEYHVKNGMEVHPDLKKLFKRLQPIMARLFGKTSFLNLVESDDFNATAKQKDQAREYADGQTETIEATGVSFSGSGDNIGVVITGLVTFPNGQKGAVNSPRIKFDSFSFGFEEELEEICEDIETEVYDYLYKNKKAQLELFGE